MRPTLLVIVAVAMLVAAGTAAQRPVGSGAGSSVALASLALPSGEIVFTRSVGDSGRPDLYAMAADGSHVRLLVTNAADASVSPDGSRIAFVRGGAIWVMQRDSSGQRQLTKPIARPPRKGQQPALQDSGPAWSPDGRTVYFSRYVWVNAESSLFRINGDGTDLRRLTRTVPGDRGHCNDEPAPSANGRIIVYTDLAGCDHGIDAALAAVTVGGATAKLPFRFPKSAPYQGEDLGWGLMIGAAAWAPNGRALAYSVLDIGWMENYLPGPGASGIYVSSSDGSPARRIARTARYYGDSPAWSLDGNWVAFARGDERYDIWLVRSDGTGLRHLTGTKADDEYPAWLPPPR